MPVAVAKVGFKDVALSLFSVSPVKSRGKKIDFQNRIQNDHLLADQLREQYVQS